MRTALIIAAASALLLGNGCEGEQDSPSGSGFIETTQVVVSAEAAGRLLELYFDEGHRVGAGSILGVIDSTTVHLRYQQALARRAAAEANERLARIAIEQAAHNLELAGKEFERVSALLGKGSANQQQFDQAKNNLEQARLARAHAEASLAAAGAEKDRIDAELRVLEKDLRDCSPRSPISGIAVDRFVEAGELVAPGTPLIEIAKLDTVWVKVYVPARDLIRVAIGGTATVDPEDARGSTLQGRVSWVSERAEFTPKNVQTKQARADLVYAVKVEIPNPDQALKVGMPVMVTIP